MDKAKLERIVDLIEEFFENYTEMTLDDWSGICARAEEEEGK